MICSKNNHIKVLLVEDVHIEKLITIFNLKNIGIENIDTASDGLEALKKVSENKYDLILMDIQMPNMNGIEASIKIKKNGLGTPIIALSSDSIKIYSDNIKELGFDDFLLKPIEINDLKNKINQYIDFDEKHYIDEIENEITIEGLDNDKLQTESYINKNKLYEILLNFENNYKNFDKEIDLLIPYSEDFNFCIHKLKGTSNIIKALKIPEIILEIQNHKKSDDEISILISDLKNYISTINNSIRINIYPLVKIETKENILNIIKKIIIDLENNSIISFIEIFQVSMFIKDIENLENAEKLKKLFINHEFDKIETVLINLKKKVKQ